ncbi:MAG: VOC family protein [Saprospiraceae bacterium]|nr:VOC family protein [Saprospiraceae bacterium]
MDQRIAHIALVVKEYNEAIEWYSKKLGFELIEDTPLDEVKRWVLMKPPGAKECCLLLARAANEDQLKAIGSQTGGRVFLFLHTDDFWRDFHSYSDRGITFVRPPHEFDYGTVAVFEDLYGNMWDLIQPKESNKGKL